MWSCARSGTFTFTVVAFGERAFRSLKSADLKIRPMLIVMLKGKQTFLDLGQRREIIGDKDLALDAWARAWLLSLARRAARSRRVKVHWKGTSAEGGAVKKVVGPPGDYPQEFRGEQNSLDQPFDST